LNEAASLRHNKKAVSILPPRCQQKQAWQKRSKHKR